MPLASYGVLASLHTHTCTVTLNIDPHQERMSYQGSANTLHQSHYQPTLTLLLWQDRKQPPADTSLKRCTKQQFAWQMAVRPLAASCCILAVGLLMPEGAKGLILNPALKLKCLLLTVLACILVILKHGSWNVCSKTKLMRISAV